MVNIHNTRTFRNIQIDNSDDGILKAALGGVLVSVEHVALLGLQIF